jgi:Domain of unknown function (DUF4440)
VSRMIRNVALVLACLLPAGAVRADQGPAPQESVKAELQALMTALNTALAAHDRAALERIYADDFLFVHALGVPVDKTRQIAAAMAAPPGGSLPVPSFEGLLVYGDVAILRAPDRTRFGTSIYVRRDGRWQVLQIQGTPMPATPAAVTIDSGVLTSYAGRYQQDNGLLVTLTLENGGLSLQVDGRQKLALTADSASHFTLPAGAGEITFATSSSGTTYEVRRGNGIVIKGIRMPDRR